MYHLISMRQNISRGLVVFGKVIGIPLFAYLVLVGYQTWQAAQNGPVLEPATLTSLTENTGELQGSLYFSAITPSDELRYPNIFIYRFADDSTQELFPYPAFAYNFVSAAYAAVMGPLIDTEDPDDVQPLWYSPEREEIGPLPSVNQYNEDDLVTSPDNIHYAYSYQEAADADPFDLLSWNVALHNFETGEVLIIPFATEPHFFNQGADLAFMTSDGIYRYTLATQEIAPLYQAYENLTSIDDYAISPDSTKLILTAPSAHIVSVAGFNQDLDQFQELGVHLDTNYRYRHPIFSPDSILYASTVVEESNFDPERNRYTNISIEVRTVAERELLKTLDFSRFIPESVYLDSWLTE